ncbi:MAG: alcohol dehydrogenase catalytic domain-containing protein, partial [Actinobacteria bacterium]|nr:alcohol dehydrogenase catalytic domain-containing protein [Actinomycetota bacterium]
MRAVALRDGELIVRDDVPDPTPEFGQVLVEVKACGICGSDLHFAKHGHEMLALGAEMGGVPAVIAEAMRPDVSRDIFMGHEFAAEVLDSGPDTTGPAAGTIVTSIPVMLSMSGMRDLAYSNELPSGYGERMLLSVPMLVEVPNGLDPRHAALTEPMAVGLHAVNRSGIKPGEGALVLGCGPVGLAVIAALKLKGIEPIVASDFST